MQCIWKACEHWPTTARRGRRGVVVVSKEAQLGDREEDGHTDGAFFAGELALGASAFEVDSADSARVVGVLGKIPLPGRDGVVARDGDLHVAGIR
jgi:hypothetical protein